jgi:glycogen operon protein
VIYEAHVRGLTKLHPELPEALRGTYARHRHPVILSYLRELGVTAIELMPVHAFVRRPAPARPGVAQLLGLQQHRLLRARHPLTAPAESSAARCASSRRWSRRCTARASR